jgi:hypothetical protein
MRFRDTYRVPLLLLSCFVTAMVFPRACAETRVGLGALVPATAPLTGADVKDPVADLREENARLVCENARYSEEFQSLPLGVGGALADAKIVRRAKSKPATLVPARVLHRDVSATRCSFLIDVGRADGVEVGAPVLHGGSIVGVIVAATARDARVVRIDDPGAASALLAAVLAEGDKAERGPVGVARGLGDGEIAVSLLAAGDAKPGDLVVTAAGDARVPEGLVIGEVARFADDSHDGSFEAHVRPLRDLDALNSVVVMLRDGDAGPSLVKGARK